jgi:hypothetical protein
MKAMRKKVMPTARTKEVHEEVVLEDLLMVRLALSEDNAVMVQISLEAELGCPQRAPFVGVFGRATMRWVYGKCGVKTT